VGDPIPARFTRPMRPPLPWAPMPRPARRAGVPGRAGRPIRRSNFTRQVWIPATRAAGVEGLRFHDLRHTATTLAVAAGASTRELMVRMDHYPGSRHLGCGPALPARNGWPGRRHHGRPGWANRGRDEPSVNCGPLSTDGLGRW